MSLIDELEREKAHAEGMTAAAAHWMARAQNAERRQIEIAALLVHAAGGRIEIGLETIGIAPELELIREDCPENFSLVCRTRRRRVDPAAEPR